MSPLAESVALHLFADRDAFVRESGGVLFLTLPEMVEQPLHTNVLDEIAHQLVRRGGIYVHRACMEATRATEGPTGGHSG